jgi:pyruvate formate lyase activating enzyme
MKRPPARQAAAGARCAACGRRSPLISEGLGACLDCIRSRPEEVLPAIAGRHAVSRRPFGLPESPPQAADGGRPDGRVSARCRFCVNECVIPEGGLGYCGLRSARARRSGGPGRLVHLAGMREAAVVEWYFDPLPTNCVAEWVCAEGTHRGFKNLAVFYGACGFNCLFCQNWQYRSLAGARSPVLSADELAARVDDTTACICFFGGDPSPQMPHALATAEGALKAAGSRSLRICWETNGSMHPSLLRRAARLSLDSGGTIKFDLKAWNENLHRALCGTTNRRTLDNFRWLAEAGRARPRPPLLVASTLLVPGYVDAEEVEHIALFIAGLNPHIPYALLAFHPHFHMYDLPRTSRRHAQECLEAAREAGLTNIRVGNLHLLSETY